MNQRGKSELPTLLSADDLRQIVGELIASTIDTHRSSRAELDVNYKQPSGPSTEQEINDFIGCSPLYDVETIENLLDPGLLGFGFRSAKVTPQALAEFRANTTEWATTNEWLAADLIPYHVVVGVQPDQTELWKPTSGVAVSDFTRSRSALMIAADLLKQGRLLSEIDWQSFERLIGDLLEREGWRVEVTRGSKDGGVDVIASMLDANIGSIKTFWQAKRYGPTNKVSLAQVRELSGLISRERVTKGIIVTTSHLTRGALDWVRKDTYRLSSIDGPEVEAWVRLHL
jgi:Restriction endonuclease